MISIFIHLLCAVLYYVSDVKVSTYVSDVKVSKFVTTGTQFLKQWITRVAQLGVDFANEKPRLNKLRHNMKDGTHLILNVLGIWAQPIFQKPGTQNQIMRTQVQHFSWNKNAQPIRIRNQVVCTIHLKDSQCSRGSAGQICQEFRIQINWY
jgi:hypothetical protein